MGLTPATVGRGRRLGHGHLGRTVAEERQHGLLRRAQRRHAGCGGEDCSAQYRGFRSVDGHGRADDAAGRVGRPRRSAPRRSTGSTAPRRRRSSGGSAGRAGRRDRVERPQDARRRRSWRRTTTLLVRYGTDYTKVAHEKRRCTAEQLSGCSGRRSGASFPNEQRFDLEGPARPRGSASYAPLPGSRGTWSCSPDWMNCSDGATTRGWCSSSTRRMCFSANYPL